MSLQPNLFDDIRVQAPPTEGVKYAGSKLKLIPYILALAQKTSARTVLDGFAGTTRVSQAFARSGYTVVCNDHAAWSHVFGTCYLLSHKNRQHYRDLIAYLNTLTPRSGWFTEHYGGDPLDENGPKRPWQRHNTEKLDAIREEIDSLGLDVDDKAVALTSLILAMDRVDSTLGHFVSYLRDWAPRSFNKMKLEVPSIVSPSLDHRVEHSNIQKLAPNVNVDLAYYDPPYGSNNDKMPPSRVRYASYYHVWTTICLNDKPVLFGKANRRTDCSDKIAKSCFEEFRRDSEGRFVAVEAIRGLLNSTNARYIILSYSSGGRATSQELNEAISSSGELIEVVEVDYRRNVMAGMTWSNEWLREAERPNREFLFLIER